MHSRTLRIVAAASLLICLVCPILETFDRWDHTMQTGVDSESALVLVALCVGATIAFTRFVLKLAAVKTFLETVLRFLLQDSFLGTLCGAWFVIPIPLSPPPLALRI